MMVMTIYKETFGTMNMTITDDDGDDDDQYNTAIL